MKTVLYTIVFNICAISFAQDPNPELFRTWHLYYYDNDGVMFNIPEIFPAIYPYLSISENFDFNGEGACNVFSGTYSSITDITIGQAINYSQTNDDCGISVHNYFEQGFFYFMQSELYYFISQDSSGFVLNLHAPLMDYAEFRSYPLSTQDYFLKTLNIYPNPVQDLLHIESGNSSLMSISLYTISGKIVFKTNSNLQQLDLSRFPAGLYFIKLENDRGKMVTKKIIKK